MKKELPKPTPDVAAVFSASLGSSVSGSALPGIFSQGLDPQSSDSFAALSAPTFSTAVAVPSGRRTSAEALTPFGALSGGAFLRDAAVEIASPAQALVANAFSLRSLYADSPRRAKEFLSEYHEVYRKAFPDSNEALSLESIEKMLRKRDCSWDITVVCDGTHIVAGYHTCLEVCGGKLFSLGDYLWVDQEYKRMGVGKELYHALIQDRQSKGAVAHLGEVNDPHLMTSEQKSLDASSGITPEQRRQFWAKQGRLCVDAPWFQPPLREGTVEVAHLMLTVHPLTPELTKLSRETLLDIWRGFYLTFDYDCPINATLDKFMKMTEPKRDFRFIPIAQKRTFINDYAN